MSSERIQELESENQQLREQVKTLETRISSLEDGDLISSVTVQELVEAIDHIRSLASDIGDVAKAALDEV